MLPQSPDMLRFVTCDLAVNSITVLGTGVNYAAGPRTGPSNFLTAVGATYSLTAAQSGSVISLDTSTGQVITLPAPVAGLNFRFITPVSVVASGTYKIITSAGTVYLVGAVSYGILDTTPGAAPGPKFTAANGTSHVAITMNGSTTGGLQGTVLQLDCVSATIWHISGLVIASGTISTPFATS